MVKRSRKHRKRFSCGHRGFGRWCHRCLPTPLPEPTAPPAAPVILVATRRTRKQGASRIAKWQWQQSFAQDPIDLTHLPKPIVLKTRRILQRLNQGMTPGQMQGKRFNFDRTLVRIPVSYRYRLLCRWYADRLVPLQVLTHEAYNAVARNQRQMPGG